MLAPIPMHGKDRTAAEEFSKEKMLVSECPYTGHILVDRRPMNTPQMRNPYQILTHDQQFVAQFRSKKSGMAELCTMGDMHLAT